MKDSHKIRVQEFAQHLCGVCVFVFYIPQVGQKHFLPQKKAT